MKYLAKKLNVTEIELYACIGKLIVRAIQGVVIFVILTIIMLAVMDYTW